MRILHIITSLRMGGAEKLMVDLLPKLKQNGIEVELCVFDGIETPLKSQFANTGIRLIEFSKNRNVYHPANLIALVKLLRSSNYNLIHTHNTAPQLFAAIASVLCSVVLCTTEHTTSNRRRGSMWYRLIDKWMYSRYKNIICISDKTEEALIKSLPNFNISTKVINNGIDIKKYSSALASGIDKESDGCRIALLQVAGFRYQKDQKTVIKSLLLLPQDVHVYFVGDGEKKNECIDYAREAGVSSRTHFLGIRSDVENLLKAADIVVMSSHWEGFGLAAVEGMAAGKPVIASNVPGLAEVVSGAGILFEASNYNELAEKILNLTSDKELYQEFAAKCRERANQFSIDRMADGYKQIYQDILATQL